MTVKENGHAEVVMKPKKEADRVPEKSTLRWTMGLVVRLCIWYTLLTPFFRCPSRLADLDGTSPRVCQPYLIARSHVEPFVTPYYDTYAAPYVDQARPYVEVFNHQVYTPASKIAKSGYEKYGSPAWQQAQRFGAAQWKAQVTPRLEAAHGKANQLYLTEVDPYVQRGVAVVSPYYQKAHTALLTVYWDHFVPMYTRSQPFIGKTYSASHEILVTHVMPGARYTWSSVVYFANSSLWPHLTGLYSEQVEPQLVKIGQRLASYREGKRLRAVLEDTESSSEQLVFSTVSTAKVEPRTSTSSKTTTTTATEIVSVQPTLSAIEQAQAARARINSDLQRWQDKFAVAADKGIEDLEDRIEEIVAALIASSANSHGQSLSNALQTVATAQVSVIKQRINELVEPLPEEDAPEAEEAARDQLVTDIRTSAISVRDRAHSLREWSLAFDDELIRRVSAAVNSTLDILDSIRSLGLQEIGTRWAWMDDVTYKDWARYHALKLQLEDWRNEIRNIGMNHKSIAGARSVATGILDTAMEVAEDTAKELVRLKDVGHWKIAAREISDNFDTRTEPPPPRPKPEEEGQEAEAAEETPTTEHDDIVSGEPTDSTTSPDEKITEEPTLSSSDYISNESDETDEPVGTESERELDDEGIFSHDTANEYIHSSTRPAFGVAAAHVGSQQDPILDDEEQDTFHNLASMASDAYAEANSAFADSTSQAKVLYDIAKSQVMGQMTQTSAPAQDQLLSSIESAYSGAVKYATEEWEARFGLVRATPTIAGPLAHISSVASSRLSEGLSLASEHLVPQTAPATTSAGFPPFVLDAQRRYYEAVGLAHEHYTAFVSTASNAVYGTPTPTGALESLSSQASENWEMLVSKASEQIYGTPAPYLQRVVGDQLPQLEAIQDIVSELLVGKQPSFTESIMSKLRVAYETPYPAAAVSSASSYISGTYESASSAADAFISEIPSVEDIMQQANDQLNAAVEAASVGIYGTPKGPYEKATDAATEAFSTASAQISDAIYGHESGYINIAKEAIDDIRSKASVAIYTEEPGVMESATSRLAAAVESAQSQLVDLASGASNVASEAAEAAASHVDEATSSVKAAISSTPKDEL